jgi:hypothetical protein
MAGGAVTGRMPHDTSAGEREEIMRYPVLLVVLCLSLVVRVGRAQDATPEEKAFFDRNVGKLVHIEPTPIPGEALEKVFGAKFYKVKVSMGDNGNAPLLVAARMGDSLFQVSMPDAPADMTALRALVRPDFKLKTDADGKAFEAALDLLYPPDTRYDEKRKAIRHSGTDWTFVRGVFINDLKGLVVTTDSGGTITAIKYSREIKN